ncbi:MAG: dTMP kinase [SAR202 cluster bacterium]|jgi:dTMP kinase|nr:dTMP kinase [Chloroflexota bacterium]MDP6420370.1 dTMP kinase [SAR202 cluster bacterium]HAL46326.1 dTMP kinase [Dehalococcoidia bacterium]MDP6665044.1 dTMP kinase [SAR202 cluster bacterium]MDP6801179.1 dTMP kinase [SAR202 cluster bacterium]|tara:strand:+ start:8112 stop:8744 length:633 start_codon:yes stop_codon:yes gene_type:complete
MSSETAPKGIFVVFEGVEGSGKTTQSAKLAQRLTEAGRDVSLTVEPGGTPTGERVREWVKTGSGLTPLAELFLFNAARAALVETVISPALDGGQDIVCDRYIYSTVAYQGYGRGVDRRTIETLNSIATTGLEPDIVVLLDLPPDQGFGRKAGSALDRIELEDQDFHLKVRQGYLDQAQNDPKRWLVLDATLSESELTDAIWDRVSALLAE